MRTGAEISTHADLVAAGEVSVAASPSVAPLRVARFLNPSRGRNLDEAGRSGLPLHVVPEDADIAWRRTLGEAGWAKCSAPSGEEVKAASEFMVQERIEWAGESLVLLGGVVN